MHAGSVVNHTVACDHVTCLPLGEHLTKWLDNHCILHQCRAQDLDPFSIPASWWYAPWEAADNNSQFYFPQLSIHGCCVLPPLLQNVKSLHSLIPAIWVTQTELQDPDSDLAQAQLSWVSSKWTSRCRISLCYFMYLSLYSLIFFKVLFICLKGWIIKRENLSPLAQSPVAPTARDWPGQCQEPVTSSKSPIWMQGPVCLGYSPLPPKVLQQEAGLEVEWPGFELALVWDASTTGCGFTCYATTMFPIIF